MNDTDDAVQRLHLPERVFKPGTETDMLDRVNRASEKSILKTVESFLGADFKRLEESFLGPIITFVKRKDICFSRHLIHHFLQRRILSNSEELWFVFAEQPMRFSLREFIITTGLATESQSSPKKKKQKRVDSWMKECTTLKELNEFMLKKSGSMPSEDKIRLGVVVLVEGILIGHHQATKIPQENLLRGGSFEEFCNYPWGRIAYKALVDGVKKLTHDKLSKDQYGMTGFVMAIQIWALSSVEALGRKFGKREGPSNGDVPLILQWEIAKSGTRKDVAEIAEDKKVYFIYY